MLMRISLILAIIAALAVGVLDFVLVKEKITTLQTNLANEKAARATAEQERDKTKKKLDLTVAELTTTKANLEAANAERDKANADAAAALKRADKLSEDLAKTRKEREEIQSELASYTGTGLKPQEILALSKTIKTLQGNLAALTETNRLQVLNIRRLDNELEMYRDPQHVVRLPASLKGKVLVTDPKWEFVVLNVGENQGVLDYAQFLVSRNGRLIGKVKVAKVQKDRCIANVMNGVELGEILEGDQIIPAFPSI